MQDLIRFVRTTGIYLVGNVLIKIISFLLLPIYTKYLPPASYGTYDLNTAYITFLSSILFLDIWGGILRFMFDYKEEAEKANVVKAGCVIFTISTLVYSIAVILLGSIMGIEYKCWLLLFGLLTNIQQVMGFISRGYGKNKTFTLAGVLSSCITIMCNIWFIVVMKGSYQFLYISSCIGAMTGIIIMVRTVKLTYILKYKRLDVSLLKAMIVYSLPLSINSAAYWFLSSFNKVLIRYKLSVVENGLYAIANKFTGIISLFTQCFQMAWQELTFSKANKSKTEMAAFYTTAFQEYIKFMTLGCTGIIPCVKIFFPLLVDASYLNAEPLIPVAILAALFSCVSSFLGSILSTLKKNRYIFTTTLAGSIVNVFIAVIAMNFMGVQAANIALALGYLVIDIRRFLLIKKYVYIKVNWKLLVALFFQVLISCKIYFSFNLFYSGIFIVFLCCEAIIIYKDKIKMFYTGRRNL